MLEPHVHGQGAHLLELGITDMRLVGHVAEVLKCDNNVTQSVLASKLWLLNKVALSILQGLSQQTQYQKIIPIIS